MISSTADVKGAIPAQTVACINPSNPTVLKNFPTFKEKFKVVIVKIITFRKY